jgi:transposase-like protein
LTNSRKYMKHEIPARIIRCKYCRGTGSLVHFGYYKGIPRYFCTKCKHKFSDNGATFGMRTPVIQVATALSMFFDGMSLSGIKRNLQQIYGSYPSDSSIYGWILKFAQKAITLVETYKATTSGVWIVIDSVIRIGGINFWFCDIIDTGTDFLLATNFSTTKTSKDAEVLMLRALTHSNHPPNTIITNKNKSYLKSTEDIFGAYTRHLYDQPHDPVLETAPISYYHMILQDRTKVMSRMQNTTTAKLISDCWLVHYNYFRPNDTLHGSTPAQAAGIPIPYRNWLDILLN